MQKSKKFIYIFLTILLVGFIFRAYKFHDWMHYQLDQARDFKVVHSAIKWGIGELPLQGPKAAGNVEIKSESGKYDDTTTLRLGPLFYYMEYGSALVFGDTPTGSLILLLLFSLLTIPLFYLFSREFFEQKISLILSAIFSVSIFFVTYSRFGWNPNLMPFFMLLTMFCLLQATKNNPDKINGLSDFYNFFRLFKFNKVTEKTTFCSSKNDKSKCFLKIIFTKVKNKIINILDFYKKNPRKLNGWLLIFTSSSLAFLTNMHFLAFTIAPTVIVLYLVITFFTRPKIALKFWIASILVFIFLNIPLIINDIKTNGENTKAFISALLNKTGNEVSEDEEGENLEKSRNTHNIFEKLITNIGEHERYFMLILTGYQKAEIPKISDNDIRCDQSCRDGLFMGGISLILILLSVSSFLYFYIKEKNREKRNFLNLVGIWLGVNFFAYVPLAYDLAPRFFLLSGPAVLVLWGMVLKLIYELKEFKFKKHLVFFVWGLTLVFIISNIYFVFKYFSELSQANNNSKLEIETDHILKEKVRMTLQQMEEITDFIENRYKENNYPVFLDAQAEFKRAFWERLDFRRIPRDPLAKDLKPLYREGNYFIILRTQSDEKDYIRKFLKGMDLINTKNFGTLTIYELKPKEDSITDENKVFPLEERTDPEFSSSAQVRYLWRQIFD